MDTNKQFQVKGNYFTMPLQTFSSLGLKKSNGALEKHHW